MTIQFQPVIQDIEVDPAASPGTERTFCQPVREISEDRTENREKLLTRRCFPEKE